MSTRTIAFSISESPDLLRLGMSPRALDHAMIEIARYLLRAGAQIAYGGDLRENGFTIALFELVRRYRRDDPKAPPVLNYLSWSKHANYPNGFLCEKMKEYAGAARIIPLDADGKPLPMPSESAEPRDRRIAIDVKASMTAMRAHMAEETHARIVIGGKVTQFSAGYPGLAVETALTLEQDKPVVLVGGFGGSTRDISAALGYGIRWERDRDDIDEPYRNRYYAGIEYVKETAAKHPRALPQENAQLADSRNLPEIIQLVMRATGLG
jgi:hypothetical protein